jgi:DNA-binding MarR family transcriptional regulator
MSIPPRDELIAAVAGALGKDVSTWTVLFHAAIAERLGLGPTDHKAFTLIDRHGPLTAGDVAALTGLTTGAVTGVIDRLERAGYVQRTKDPRDRRKVVIVAVPTPAHYAALQEIFGPLMVAVADMCAPYSDEELVTVVRFMRDAVGLMQGQIERLRGGVAAGDDPGAG